MALSTIFKNTKKLWKVWDLRLSILASLLLQAFLLVLAPFRNRCRSNLLFRSIWATYLLADWVAAVSIGLITKSQRNHDHLKENGDVFALWASFLLLHLGGPDGITSLSLEDNELWIRHLFGLCLQVMSAAYSFYLTFPENKLWLPIVLVFVAGTIKFGERTWALRLASLDKFGATTLPDPNPGPDYQEAAAIYSVGIRSAQFETQAQMTMNSRFGNFITRERDNQENREMKLMEVSYSRFESFKGLIVGFLLGSKDRDASRSYFVSEEDASLAFRSVEYELSFMYQVLHTKAVVIHSTVGYILRSVSFFCIIAAFLLFLSVDKDGIPKSERVITSILFIGAFVLDAISIGKIIVSDWSLLRLKDNWIIRYIPKFFWKRGRWSGSVSQNNMINDCLAPSLSIFRIHKLRRHFRKYCFSKTVFMILSNFSTSEVVDDEVKKFIFQELKRKAKKASSLRDATEMCSQRGELALLENPSSYVKLKWSIGEYQYAESLLLWHLATELCYQCSETNPSTETNNLSTVTIWKLIFQTIWKLFFQTIWKLIFQLCCKCCGHQEDRISDHRRISKLISDYLFYLLINKQPMMAPVLGHWMIVFQDTKKEAKRVFGKHKIWLHSEACQKIFDARPRVRSTTVKGNRSKSVLFDACILAQQLQLEENQWEIMSQVWVEMLSYAAINCRPFVHAQQLSKGGELLSFSWLLMNHFGLGTQFSEQELQSGTKMTTIIE
ncbi:hypothetical protein UlMin_007388 [Ulmus minor]